MKNLKLIFQILVMFFITFSYLYLLPNQVKSIRNNNYLTTVFNPVKDDYEKYVPLMAEYSNVVFKKDYVKHHKVGDNDNYIEMYLFKVASVNLDKNVNSYFVFIKDAKYQGIKYNELSLRIKYKDIIKDDISETTQITMNESPLRGFFITELVNNDKKNEIESLEFGIMVSRNKLNTNFLKIALEEDDKFLLNILDATTFEDGLNEKISSDTNIPTEEEKISLNIDYKEFDQNIINSYFKHGWLIYFFYSIVVLVVVYYLYVKDLMKLHKKRYEIKK